MPSVDLVSPDGDVESFPSEQMAVKIASGYKPAAEGAKQAQTVEQATTPESTLGGKVVAGLTSIGAGATLGASDWALRGILNKGQMDYVSQQRAAAPVISTAGQIAGAIAPALLGDEAGLAGLTPSGFTAKIGSKIAGLGEGAGIVGKAAATAAAGSFEGAAQNAGSYISDVALGDRDATAQGFFGAMGKGALYGGVAGGALSVASNGLMAARRLIPLAEQTPEGLAAAESAAANAVTDSVGTSSRLESAGKGAAQQIDRETDQLLRDLEQERANARASAGAAEPPPRAAPGETSSAPLEAEAAAPQPPEAPPGDPRQLMRQWREKYPEGAVDYNAANAAARRGRLQEWANGFEATTPEDETIKAYFQSDKDPLDVGRDLSGVPKAVQTRANQISSEAAHQAYLDAVPKAADVSESGTELMARAQYASKRAAAKALDDVYTAYKAGAPIIDIQAAASKGMMNRVSELADARTDMLKSLAGKPAVADDLMAKLQGAKAGLDQGQSLGEMILNGPPRAVDPDEAVSRALGKSADVNQDIVDIAPKITRYEAAKAHLTESLGPDAPPDAVAHAQAFRAAQQKAQTASARNVAQAADTMDKAVAGAPSAKLPGGKSTLGALANKAQQFGSALEVLKAMGVPVPDPHSIPVIGPLLSAFLKAKVLGKIMGNHGGSFLATAEGTIAAKAVTTQNRINTAVSAMVLGSKVTAKASELVGPSVLAHKLFDTKATAPYNSDPKAGKLEDDYRARLGELTAAVQPGAIEQSLKARINTTDPSILDALIANQTRNMQYLYGKAAKPDQPALPGQPQRSVSKAEITDFGIILGAYHDPAAVFERVAAGGVARPAEVDCVGNCYPSLLATARTNAVQQLADAKESPSYAKRVAISTLLGIPMDSTMMPDHMAYLSKPGAPAPAAAPPVPHSTLSSRGNVTLGQQTLTGLDSRS